MTKAPVPPDAAAKPAADAQPASVKKPASRRKPAPGARAERVRGGEARRIADLVPAIGDMAFRKFGFVQSAIITRWPEIVGDRLAKVTMPESLRFPVGKKADGTLHIAVAGAHAVIVQHVIPDIITRVNRFFGYGAVARISLVQGGSARAGRRQRDATAQRAARATGPQAAATGAETASVRAISDPELRAVLEGLASALAKRDGLPKIS